MTVEGSSPCLAPDRTKICRSVGAGIRWFGYAGGVITILLALLDAHALVPEYANLSIVGLGATPTTASLLDRTKPREVSVLQTPVSVSQKGDMSWSVPLPAFPGIATVPVSIT